MQNRIRHWEDVYSAKAATEVSWFQKDPAPSLAALDRHGVPANAAFIDIGGGASVLVDWLVERGWTDISVLDIAAPALEMAKARLGKRADHVHWIVADITNWQPHTRFDIWHDRAVFHFLIEPAARSSYRKALLEGLKPGGLLVIATFALDGPEKCSGLPVRRYSAEDLVVEIGEAFELLEDWRETHTTPWGSEQSFTWCVFRRRTQSASKD